MTTQKIEFEYTARNESAGSRAWQEGRSAIDGYNRELTETNTKARQAAEAMSAFGNKGKEAYQGLTDRQKAVQQGIERLRIANQHAERDAHSHRQSVIERSRAMRENDAYRSSQGFASSATRARRASASLEFQDTVLSRADLAGLGQGDSQREQRLTTGSRFRGQGPASGRRSSLLGGMGMGMQMLAGGAMAGAVNQISEANNRFIEKADGAAEAYDTLSRSLNIQAGLTGAAAQEARQRILSIALDAAADKNFAFGLSTQMVSSGFSATEATGGSLQEMLKGINAMPAPGGQQVDPVALAEAATSYMTSQNMDKTGENLRSVLAGVQQLYKSTNFQLADFTELAGQADVMRGKMSMGEQFGSFSVLRDVGKSAEEATTALRNIALRAQTAGGSSEKTEALASIGLKPEDIDMVGESFQDVLNRLAHATDGVDPAKVTIALEKVFGERTLAGLLRLVEDREKVKERTGAIGDQTQYEADAKQMSTGVAAAKRRQTMEAETFAVEHSQKDDLLKTELSQQARERGVSEARIAIAEKQYSLIRGTGRTREMAGAAAYGDFGIGVGGNERVEEAKRGLSKKGVNLDPSMTYANPNNMHKSVIERTWDNMFGTGEPDFLKAPANDEETDAKRIERRRGTLQTTEEALKVQPKYKSLPRPGAKTSAPAPAVADVGGSVEMKNSRLERGTEQQVTLLAQIATGISELNERLDRPSGGREPRRATPPWNPRQPPPLPAVVSLSASEVG